MSKNHKLTYAVNETNTKVIIINETNTVSDVLDIIQKNEKDNEYNISFMMVRKLIKMKSYLNFMISKQFILHQKQNQYQMIYIQL